MRLGSCHTWAAAWCDPRSAGRQGWSSSREEQVLFHSAMQAGLLAGSWYSQVCSTANGTSKAAVAGQSDTAACDAAEKNGHLPVG